MGLSIKKMDIGSESYSLVLSSEHKVLRKGIVNDFFTE
jgi:hypothetical protein